MRLKVLKLKSYSKPIPEAIPCPHCGCNILYEVKRLSEITHRGRPHIFCPTCGALGGGGGDTNEALQKWNLRVQSY